MSEVGILLSFLRTLYKKVTGIILHVPYPPVSGLPRRYMTEKKKHKLKIQAKNIKNINKSDQYF